MAKVTKTILIVEDEDASRALLREVLVSAGYSVLEAMDGLQALVVLGKQKVDLVITDRAMPGMGGLELLKKMKEKKIPVPSLMISGYGEEAMWGQAIGYGARDYILKPFQEEPVLALVKKILMGEKGK